MPLPQIQRPGYQPSSLSQPFGQEQLPLGAVKRPRFLAFGIPFMLVYAGLGGGLIYASLNLASFSTDLAPINPRLVLVYVGIGLVLLAFALVSGVLCILGRIAGVYIGAVPVFLNLASVLYSMLRNDFEFAGLSLVGLLVHLALAGLGMVEIRRAAVHKASLIAPRGIDSHPVVPRQTPTRPHIDIGTPVPGPRQAALTILLLAASLEPAVALARLAKARFAAERLLGSQSRAEIARTLASPVDGTDFPKQLQGMIQNVGDDSKFASGLRRCIDFVLKEGPAAAATGQLFLATYDRCLARSSATPRSL